MLSLVSTCFGSGEKNVITSRNVGDVSKGDDCCVIYIVVHKRLDYDVCNEMSVVIIVKGRLQW